MLTRSRKEADATLPDNKLPISPRRRGRSKSETEEKIKIRNRSRPSNKNIPRVPITTTSWLKKKMEEIKKRSIDHVYSKLGKSPPPVKKNIPLRNKISNVKFDMLTRSKTEEAGVTLPEIKLPTSSRRPRSRRKSEEKKKIRSQSRSPDENIPRVTIYRNSDLEKMAQEIRKKRSIEHLNLKLCSSPTPVNRNIPLGDKIFNFKTFSAYSSKLYYDDPSDSGSFLVKNTRATVLPSKFGSFGNTVLALLMPILVIVAKIALKSNGVLIPFPRGYLRFDNYYVQDVLLWTTAIVTFQFLISLLPLYKKSIGLQNDNSNPIYYRFSGPINLLLIVCALIIDATNYYKLPLNFIQDIAITKSIPHIVASVFCAFIISIALYIKSKYTSVQNLHTQSINSLNVVQKLFIGSTNNPTLWTINIKLALYRYSSLLTILFNYVIIMDSLKNAINIHLYVVVGFQILYAVDKLIFEFNLLSSFYLQIEKDGYCTLIQPFLQPAINVLPIQVLLVNNLPVNYIILSISSIIFLVGLICERYIALTKYWYEKNSNYVEGGRKVNHSLPFMNNPNYLSTIIVHLAVILPVFVPSLDTLQISWPMFLYPLYYIVTLSHQCICT